MIFIDKKNAIRAIMATNMKTLLDTPVKGDFFGYNQYLAPSETPLKRTPSPLRWYELNKNIWGESGAFLCGGAMVDFARGETPRDLDLYFNSEKALKRGLVEIVQNGYTLYEKHLQDLEKGTWQIIISHPGNKAMYPDLNLVVSQWFEDIPHVLGLFDLDICCIGVSYSQLWHTGHWFKIFNEKTFRYHVVSNMIATQKRVLKYTMKGFTFEQHDSYRVIEAGTKFY